MSTEDDEDELSPREWFARHRGSGAQHYAPIIERLEDEDHESSLSGASAKELWERQLIRDWRGAVDEQDRATRARDLMGRVATDLAAGRQLTGEMAAWLASALKAAQFTGDADRAFGLKNPKHRPKKVVPVGLAYAAAIHALSVWCGSTKSEAAGRLHGAVFQPEPRSLADAHADADREFWIDGPFVLLKPAKGAQPFEVDRRQIVDPDKPRPPGSCIVVEFITREPPRCSWHIDVGPLICALATVRE